MQTKALGYRDDTLPLSGILVYDDSGNERRPGIVLFPDARGIGRHAIERAHRLAAMGFAVLVADLYGNGKSARNTAHAWKLMDSLRSDITRWRGRAHAALNALTVQAIVDNSKLAAIGLCFGGSTALELARSAAPLAAVVSFHGGLHSEQPEDARNIRAKVLVCHGAMDPLVPRAQLTAFEEQMSKTDVDWQVHEYGGRCTPSPIRMPTRKGWPITPWPTSAHGTLCSLYCKKLSSRANARRASKGDDAPIRGASGAVHLSRPGVAGHLKMTELAGVTLLR